jgi:polar amino acid transport system ATP-binding protein
MTFAREVADRVVFMDGGVIVEDGTPEQVIGNPAHERTRHFLSRLLDPAMADVPEGTPDRRAGNRTGRGEDGKPPH